MFIDFLDQVEKIGRPCPVDVVDDQTAYHGGLEQYQKTKQPPANSFESVRMRLCCRIIVNEQYNPTPHIRRPTTSKM